MSVTNTQYERMKILIGIDKKEEKIGAKQLLLFLFLNKKFYFLVKIFAVKPRLAGLFEDGIIAKPSEMGAITTN